MAKPVKTATFNKRRYDIYIGRLKGLTTVSRQSPLEMVVRTDQVSEKMVLNTLIHEALHASNWDTSEKKVKRTADDISSFLWRLGYRRTGTINT